MILRNAAFMPFNRPNSFDSERAAASLAVRCRSDRWTMRKGAVLAIVRCQLGSWGLYGPAHSAINLLQGVGGIQRASGGFRTRGCGKPSVWSARLASLGQSARARRGPLASSRLSSPLDSGAWRDTVLPWKSTSRGWEPAASLTCPGRVRVSCPASRRIQSPKRRFGGFGGRMVGTFAACPRCPRPMHQPSSLPQPEVHQRGPNQ